MVPLAFRLAAGLVGLFAATAAHAQNAGVPPVAISLDHPVTAIVNVSEQSMSVYVDGQLRYLWPVSTGRGEDDTPRGAWNAYWLSPNHRSSLFNNAPMPWAVFYNGNFAVHGTMAVADLGRRASHGCVRLHPEQAEVFFRLVEAAGLAGTLIQVVD